MRRNMLKAFFAIGLLVATAAQAAPRGKPFLKGVGTPQNLASKVEASLAKDPTGNSVIDHARCGQDGSCARPVDYVEMFRLSDPAARPITAKELPDFLRTLRVEEAPRGEYWLACLKDGKPVLHCVARRFKPGEKVWVNPQTGRILLAQDCTNPVERPVRARCVEVHFTTKLGDDVVRFALLGPAPIASDCYAIKKAGEEEWEALWRDECASADCNFGAVSAVVRQPVQTIGSYLPEPGDHILRLPAEAAIRGSLYRTALCLDRGGLHSDGIGVQAQDYVFKSPNGEAKARVWYDRTQVPERAPFLHWSWGQWGR